MWTFHKRRVSFKPSCFEVVEIRKTRADATLEDCDGRVHILGMLEFCLRCKLRRLMALVAYKSRCRSMEELI